ncbi:MAG: PAS domain-containing protein [Sneathiella sp.]|nr:PAS domain-containing protein [Sneathiella sp.]
MKSNAPLFNIKNPEQLEIYNRLHSVIWVFNIDEHRFWWANNAAIKFWEKQSLADFLSVDLSDDSEVVRERLKEIFQTATIGEKLEENWTVYPDGKPKMVMVTFTPVILEKNKKGLLIEASPQLKEELDPRAKRILEAVRYTPLIISTFSNTGMMIAQNPAAAKLYGSGEKQDTMLQSRYTDPLVVETLLNLGDEQQRFATDIQVQTRTGQRWHTLNAEAGRDPVTGDKVIIITEEDITERANTQQQLQQLNATLEQRVAARTEELSEAIRLATEANKAKTDFLATMSHELRTPLNAIIGFSEMLSSGLYGPTTEKQAVTICDINRSGRYLLEQINDLLDASTIDRGELNLFESNFSLSSTFDYCATIFEMEAKRKNQNLRFIMPPQDMKIHADEHRFTQIVTNLISNALKYTPNEGSVTVSAELTKASEVSINVADTGIGIAEDHLEVVTQAFTQIDISSSFVSGKGVGLGLYITSSLLKAHQGSLLLEPNNDRGLTARAILPASRLV